ncbi:MULTISPECIES: hypothetical protein [Metabacillus]|uniref:Uncharacterized protein n=2 Tax=Metabacillus TaxID=2675233 RepID=A0ABX6S275_9BACI|nr:MULTISPECIES: hypothetical protein [Metabacillus]QNF27843.1 hypothetical protein HUW50_10270 [Metabacillus sp. KUDC1714]
MINFQLIIKTSNKSGLLEIDLFVIHKNYHQKHVILVFTNNKKPQT